MKKGPKTRQKRAKITKIIFPETKLPLNDL